MDYFSVIVLIIVVFIFMADRKVKTIEAIRKENNDILKEIETLKQNLKLIKVEPKDMEYSKLQKNIETIKQEYVLIQNEEIKLNENDVNKLIANYIKVEKNPCGFNLQYSYNEKKWSFKKLYIDIINYLNIFNKQEISTYGVVISTKEDLTKIEKEFKEKLISYIPTEITNVNFTNDKIKKEQLKEIYIRKLNSANISIILKLLLLIISGSIITTNLVYSVFDINNNINSLIIAIVIYYCYSYIIRYIYKPIGKQRVVASYIFPLYFIAYVFVSIQTLISKVIKKVHAS